MYFNGRAQTRVLVAFAAIGAFTQSPTTHAAEIRTVALSGWHAPGVPDGVSFNAFHFPFGVNNRTPALNNSGQTAFEASLTGNGIDSANFAGIWSEGSGSLTLVARQGSPAPGTPSGVNFGNAFESIVLNDAGRIAFYATNLTGSGVSAVNDAGVWSEGSGSLALVAREGDQAPGTSSGVNYVGFGYPVLNNAGQTAFFGRLEGSGVDSTNNNGLWSEGSGTLSLVGRSGAQAPGAPSGVTFLFDGSIRPPALNDAGQIAFRGNLTGGDSGVWSEGSGTLALVARSGMPAPGAASGVTYTGVGIPMLNDAGQTAFYAGLTGSGVDASNDQGIWSEGSGSLKLVAREAEQAPGTPSGVNFASFSIGASNHPVINNTGQTAFYAQITGAGVDGSNFNGIWLDGSDGLALVARAGDHAPGTPSGVNFNSDFGAVSSSVRMPVLNDVGQIAFVTGLTGSGVDTNNNAGIWATDRAGVLQLILRTGAQMEVALNDIRTIRSLGFVRGSGNGDGLSSGLNDSGQLAFVASFTDGSTGIFVSNRVAVPEPSTLLLIAAGVGVFALRLTTRPPFCLTPGVHP